MPRVTENIVRQLLAHGAAHVQHPRTMSRTATTTAYCANITVSTPPHARHNQHGAKLRTQHTTHKKPHPVTEVTSAPHSQQSGQAAQRRRDAAGQLVAVRVQQPVGHTNSHRVTTLHPMPPSHPWSGQPAARASTSAHCSITNESQSAPHMISLKHNTACG
jgi:hypothetical protein